MSAASPCVPTQVRVSSRPQAGSCPRSIRCRPKWACVLGLWRVHWRLHRLPAAAWGGACECMCKEAEDLFFCCFARWGANERWSWRCRPDACKAAERVHMLQVAASKIAICLSMRRSCAPTVICCRPAAPPAVCHHAHARRVFMKQHVPCWVCS